MTSFLPYLLILVGFVCLTFGADFLVDGASSVAKRMKISDLLIGLTVVAFGTSAPELVVNLVAAFDGNNEIALTNVLGSNIINVFIILGTSATIYPIVCQKSLRRFELPLAALAGLLVMLMAMNFFVPSLNDRGISRMDGIVLLVIFAIFMFQTIRTGLKCGSDDTEEVSLKPLGISLLMIVGGLVLLVLGGNWIVKSATTIARSWGVSDALIGVTVVALGTSLPELATSVMAVLKKNGDMAIGNVIGSNIFNIFFVLATSATIRPLSDYPNLLLDSGMAFLGCFLVLLFVRNGNHRIGRWQGLFLLAVYVMYLFWIIKSL